MAIQSNYCIVCQPEEYTEKMKEFEAMLERASNMFKGYYIKKIEHVGAAHYITVSCLRGEE